MSQRRHRSFIEAVANVALGYVVSVLLTAWLTGVGVAQAARWSTWFVLASLARAYVLRRLFARWETA